MAFLKTSTAITPPKTIPPPKLGEELIWHEKTQTWIPKSEWEKLNG